MVALKAYTYATCQGPGVIQNREAAEGLRKSKRLVDNRRTGGLELIKIPPDEVVKPEESNVDENLPQEESGRERGDKVREDHECETTVDYEKEAVTEDHSLDGSHHAGHNVHAKQVGQDGRDQGKHCEVRLVKVKLDEFRLQEVKESLELGLGEEENPEEDPAQEILVKEYAKVRLFSFRNHFNSF